MGYEFHRVDYMICGITYPHTLKVLPSTLKSDQKFAIGDKNGVLQCISIKDEEPIIHFKTLPGKSVTSVQVASAHGDKIFAASGNEVKGYTKKGKLFFTIETAFSETITSMSIVGSELILCSGKTVTFYSDMQESHTYTCEDRVLDIAVFETPNSTKLRLLILIANKGTVLLENGKLLSRITISSGPCCLAIHDSNHNSDVFSFYGANDGSIGIITNESSTLSSQCLVEGHSLGSVVCLGWHSGGGSTHLAVGRQDGSVQLYQVDIENLREKPRLKYTYFCGEPITSISGGCFGSEEQELLVVSFSGRIFALRSGQQSTNAALSKLPRDALTARRTKLELEVARLEKQTASEREKYQKSTHSIVSTLSTPPLLDIQYEILGATRDSWLETRLVAAVPLDMLFIYCDKKLSLQTDSLAVLSVCPAQENSKDFLATVRCQAGTRRLWVRMRRELPETESVPVYIYALPSGAPRVSRRIEVRIPVLPYYSQHEDLNENQSRPWCELRVSGKFSVAEITSWLVEALPGDIPRPASTVSFIRSHALVGTLLKCHYQRGLAIFKSDDISAIATMKSVVTNCSTKKGIRVEITCDVAQLYKVKSFEILQSIFLSEYEKKRKNDIRNAVSALDLDINSLNNEDDKLLCSEFMAVLNEKGNPSENNNFEEITDLIVQWNIDWHTLALSGGTSNASDKLKVVLQDCNVSEIMTILSKD